ncbi:lipoate--protein ligase [Gorillibacterium timonense]|uniref:lipoate--protein ligase n=1 Tax=Gorillibacterium timonense TaxID=1689269 RepID=UPI00071CF61A|nr:lipoate--protein ligase [Gorillibacterium timonense]
MLFIDNEGITDPRINLALEEYALKNLPADSDYLLFYINEPSIIIGKNQNTMEEINTEYVDQEGLKVVRRLSGGGAVYHDLGNLNYSFITNDDGNSFHNFRKFTDPVVAALRKLGIEAELSGRNDIQIGERKISGNAQFTQKGRMFSHGTLLFNTELGKVASALRVNAEKFKSKAVKSVSSRVANITEFLDQPMTIEEFRSFLLHSFFEGKDVQKYPLTEKDWEQVRAISAERYGNWDWNYGKSPDFNYRQVKRLTAGTYDFRLDVQNGRISRASLYGDFFGVGEVAEIEEKLAGVKYDRESVREALNGVDLKYYFGPVTEDEILDLLF